MKIVKDSAEHHFLTFLDKLKGEPAGWIGMHFAFSQKLDHADVIATPAHIPGKLHKVRRESESFVEELAKQAAPFEKSGALIYAFADNDVIMLVGPRNETERDALNVLFSAMAEKAGPRLSLQANLAKEIYSYQKMADRKFLAARRIEAYEEMADLNRIQSIGLRRTRRAEGMVLLVEDDRFTAAFAANILNKDYDFVQAKTGEDAVIAYIEHAPDIVLLDIHLPGLSGIETLMCLRKVDPESAVYMLSVDTVKTNIVASSQFGALGFLKKPFSKDRLLAAVAKSPHLKGSKAGRGR